MLENLGFYNLKSEILNKNVTIQQKSSQFCGNNVETNSLRISGLVKFCKCQKAENLLPVVQFLYTSSKLKDSLQNVYINGLEIDIEFETILTKNTKEKSFNSKSENSLFTNIKVIYIFLN